MAPRTQKVQCTFCSKEFSAQGIGTHTKACQKKTQPREGREALQEALAVLQNQGIEQGLAVNRAIAPNASIPTAGPSQHPDNSNDIVTPDDIPSRLVYNEYLDGPAASGFEDAAEDNMPDSDTANSEPVDSNRAGNDHPGPILQAFLNAINLPPVDDQAFQNVDHITIQFHPSSKKPPKHIQMRDYRPLTYHNTKASDAKQPNIDPNPWAPFCTRLDFEVAELALDTHMNKSQINRLFALLEKCASDPKQLTLRKASELEKVWAAARTCHATAFVKKEYEATYQGEKIPYEIYVRPLVNWCRDLLLDPFLIPKFRWNAERHVKVHTDGHSEAIIGEPWTANAWWKIQDRLPEGALPFCIILYADKTRLSSFGTAKAYPVIARCANLPCDIRNSSGVGGGILVGWLPIIDEDAGKAGKTVYVNFKRVVWHKGFYEILLFIQEYALTGYHIKCADEVLRWFFFFVLILSADYEEQCVMALIRGSTGNFPCPVCLVPKDEQWDLTKSYKLRTTEEMEAIYTESQALNMTDRNDYLQEVGLRNVENVFWMMNGTDVYSAISWDRLHAYHSGLFGDHLWGQFKDIINGKGMGRDYAATIDAQFNLVPRWSGLNHFLFVMKTDFSDGSKFEDMGKLIVFCSHNVLDLETTGRGYCLLKLMRSYLELDMYASLTVHTDTTIEGLCAELVNFATILEEYTNIYAEKSWNFPKNHSHLHMVRDILEKGATRNSNTKPNEKAHGLLKIWYRFHTNFKNVAPQILKLNEQDLIAMLIRMAIDFLDEVNALAADHNEEEDDIPAAVNRVPLDGLPENLVEIASPSKEISLQAFQDEHQSDAAFNRFRTKLAGYLMRGLRQNITGFTGETKITLYHLLKIHYQSLIDWTIQRDLVRVSPKFHGQPRNDWVLIKANDNEYVIAQLLTVFTVNWGNITHVLAHVLPFDGAIDERSTLARKRDKDLRFIRVRARRRKESILVDVQCIERGCLLIQDYGNDPNDFIVMNVTDQDMWWRFKVRKLGKNLRL